MKIKFNCKANAVFPDKGIGAENFYQLMKSVALRSLYENIELCDNKDKIKQNIAKSDELTSLLWNAKCEKKGTKLYFCFEVIENSILFKNKKDVTLFFKEMIKLYWEEDTRLREQSTAINDYLLKTHRYYEQVFSSLKETLTIEK